MLEQLANSFLSRKSNQAYSPKAQRREWYCHVVKRLESEGIKTPDDLEAGADLYVSLRREWNDDVAAFAKYMAFRWSDIAVSESDIKFSNTNIN